MFSITYAYSTFHKYLWYVSRYSSFFCACHIILFYANLCTCLVPLLVQLWTHVFTFSTQTRGVLYHLDYVYTYINLDWTSRIQLSSKRHHQHAMSNSSVHVVHLLLKCRASITTQTPHQRDNAQCPLAQKGCCSCPCCNTCQHDWHWHYQTLNMFVRCHFHSPVHSLAFVSVYAIPFVV